MPESTPKLGLYAPCPQPDSLFEPFLLSIPQNHVISSTDSSGSVVFFSAAAVDLNEGLLQPVCTPQSGSKFPLGLQLET